MTGHAKVKIKFSGHQHRWRQLAFLFWELNVIAGPAGCLPGRRDHYLLVEISFHQQGGGLAISRARVGNLMTKRDSDTAF